MQAVDQFKAFLLRKRQWRWLAAALALLIIGKVLDHYEIKLLGVVSAGQTLTEGLAARLKAVQPDMISDFYREAGANRHGLGLCGPTAPPPPRKAPRFVPPMIADPLDTGRTIALSPRPMSTAAIEDVLREAREHPSAHPPLRGLGSARSNDEIYAQARRDMLSSGPPVPRDPPSRYWRCDGWLGMADGGLLTLRTTPEVAWRVWKTGGWAATIVFALTLAVIAYVLLRLWSDKSFGCAVVPATLFILAMGPLLAGSSFWLTLWLLVILTGFFGHVFAGLAIILFWVLGGWNIAMGIVGVLSSADDLKEKSDLAQQTLADLRGPPPAPPQP
ncbi:hypothetical protein [Sphingomonas immobilis]|uniref:ABC transporter permease n=1 Tax=Sphingomonas immobilis TaxID=3063997 RepID=A0ABT8ZZX9_9SPHN|nr:hypothetical protein [Sphingomonas sp. CA1-15]MDO7842838.1 hypothetical protein [Sphingomonas sp. CA1-15]